MSDSQIAKRESTAIATDMAEQVALFKRMNVSEALVFTHAIVPREGGGWQLVERDRPLETFDTDAAGRTTVLRECSKTYSERMGLSRKRGRYNDADRLLGNEYGSVEVGEVKAFATI